MTRYLAVSEANYPTLPVADFRHADQIAYNICAVLGGHSVVISWDEGRLEAPEIICEWTRHD